jgi:alkylation response protein AidB-like acyl-CoA dehydrogenase
MLGGHCRCSTTTFRVPRANLLGPRGQGFLIAQQPRPGPHLPLHALAGQAQRAFDLMCERANCASPSARRSAKQQIQVMIFETAAEIQACRLLTLQAAHKMDTGDPARVEIGIIKVVGAKMLHNTIDRAIQVYGAMGVTSDTPA